MKLKATIEEAKTRARNKERALYKIKEPSQKQLQEAAYWEGIRNALDWVIGKRETGLDDFWDTY